MASNGRKVTAKYSSGLDASSKIRIPARYHPLRFCEPFPENGVQSLAANFFG